MLTKEKILEILSSYKTNQHNIKEIGLFGSFARDEAQTDSDVDIYVKLVKSNLFLLSRIRIDLEEIIDRHVDIVEVRNSMNKYLKKHIDRESVSA